MPQSSEQDTQRQESMVREKLTLIDTLGIPGKLAQINAEYFEGKGRSVPIEAISPNGGTKGYQLNASLVTDLERHSTLTSTPNTGPITPLDLIGADTRGYLIKRYIYEMETQFFIGFKLRYASKNDEYTFIYRNGEADIKTPPFNSTTMPNLSTTVDSEIAKFTQSLPNPAELAAKLAKKREHLRGKW